MGPPRLSCSLFKPFVSRPRRLRPHGPGNVEGPAVTCAHPHTLRPHPFKSARVCSGTRRRVTALQWLTEKSQSPFPLRQRHAEVLFQIKAASWPDARMRGAALLSHSPHKSALFQKKRTSATSKTEPLDHCYSSAFGFLGFVLTRIFLPLMVIKLSESHVVCVRVCVLLCVLFH